MAVSSLCSLLSCALSSARSTARSAFSVSACEWTDTYSPEAIDIDPAVRPAIPATNMLPPVAWAAATPSTKLAVERMPSFAPKTAARSQPTRSVWWDSLWRTDILASFRPHLRLERSARDGAAALPGSQELGEFHGRPRTGPHLARNRLPILRQDVRAPAAVEMAGLHIQQDIHFPRLECVARKRPAHHFVEQPLESVEHQFQLSEVVRLHYTPFIGACRQKD